MYSEKRFLLNEGYCFKVFCVGKIIIFNQEGFYLTELCINGYLYRTKEGGGRHDLLLRCR